MFLNLQLCNSGMLNMFSNRASCCKETHKWKWNFSFLVLIFYFWFTMLYAHTFYGELPQIYVGKSGI